MTGCLSKVIWNALSHTETERERAGGKIWGGMKKEREREREREMCVCVCVCEHVCVCVCVSGVVVW